MAIFTRTNGDLLPVAVMDAASYTNPGAINSVQNGATVNAFGPKLDFFTVAAGGAVTAAEMAAAIQWIQQNSTLAIYNADITTGDLIVAVYPTGGIAAAGLSSPGAFASATAYMDDATYGIKSLGGGWAAVVTSTGATFA